MSESCSIIPQVSNKEGILVDSKLFTDILPLVNGDREKATTLYLQTHNPSFYDWFGNWRLKKDKDNGSVKAKEVFNYIDQAQSRVEELNVKYGQSVARLNQSNASGRLEFQVLVSFPTDVSESVDENGEPLMVNEEFPDVNSLSFVNKDGQKRPVFNKGLYREDNNIYHQIQSPNKEKDARLDARVEAFLKKNGISLQRLNQIVDREGNKIEANAVADILYRTIKVVDGSARLDTLPEEAGHFLVEMLGEDNPLYISMYNEITSYDVYKEVVNEYSELYKGNEKSLRKEAMAKVIAQVITNQFEQENKIDRINRWWNKVLRFVKSKILGMDVRELESIIVDQSPFGEAAQKIMNGEYLHTWNLSEDAREEYYQLVKPEEIENSILNKWKIFLKQGKDRYTVIKNGLETDVKNRVSDRVKKAFEKKNFKERTDLEKSLDEIKAKYGTQGHADIANIIERAVAKRDGVMPPAREMKSTEAIYATLESHFTKFVTEFPKSSRLLVEKVIYDEKSDEAGTIDLLVIHEDGKVDIFDWKFIDFKDGETKRVPYYKVEAFNIQLPRYKEILNREYGIKSFGKVRVVPISAKYKGSNTLQSIEIGSTEVKAIGENKEYLLPLPVFEEMTGDENLDRLLLSLIQEKNKLQSTKPASTLDTIQRLTFIEKRNSDLERIQRAIREIQVKHDIAEYISIGMDTLRKIQENEVSVFDDAELLELIKTMSFYGKEMIGIIRDIAGDKTKPYHADISSLSSNSQLFEESLKDELVRRQVERGGEGLLEEQKEQGLWKNNFRTISQQTDPIIRDFNELVKRSKAQVQNDTKLLAGLIEEKIQDLRKAFPNKSGVDVFDFMLKDKNGDLEIIAKYDKDFYAKLNEARTILKESTFSAEKKASALAFIKKNTTFDTEAYQKKLQEFTIKMKRNYKTDKDGEKKVNQRIKEFREKYGNNPTGYANKNNFNVKVNEDRSLYSQEYKEILDSPEKKAFYDLWMKHSNEFQDYIGQDLGGRFVWNVPKNFVDSLMENGLAAFTNMASISEAFKATAKESIGIIDEKTGKPVAKIPAFYTQKSMVQNEKGEWVVDSKNQSRDLGKVLGVVAAMAYNHKYMSEIEGNAKALEMMLMDRETIMTDSNGGVVVNKLTNKVQKIIGSSSKLELYQDYMNYYIYGIRNKGGDYLFGKDNKYSSLAILNTISKYFVGKAIAGNPVSIVANIVGGDLSARIIGAKGMFFNNEHYANATMNLLPRALVGNKKVGAIIGLFDLVDRANLGKATNDLSVNFLTKALTFDNLFFGQKGGDYLIRNAVLMSMVQSHTLKDGKIVKKQEGDTSLLEIFDVKDGKLDIASISAEELERFRTRTLQVTDNILGNNTTDDIRAASLTVLGRAMLMFRSWMPRTIDERFGELRENQNLGEYELGRYRSFWNQIANKRAIPLMAETILGFGVFGYGGKFGNTTIEHAKMLYAEHMVKNPSDKITEQEYIDLHLGNLRANMLEIYITLTIIGMIWAVAPDDDETLEQGSLRKYAHHQIQRVLSELAFFYNPTEFQKIIKSPIPLSGLLNDGISLIKSLVFEGTEEITGDESITRKNEIRKYSFKLFPGLNGFETLLSFIEEDYDKKEAFSTSSRGR